MLGWSITVRIAPPEPRLATRESILASWVCDASGLVWLDPLIAQGKVHQTKRSGYPNEYSGLAQDLLPLIDTGKAMRRRGLGAWVIGLDEGEEYVIPPEGLVSDVVKYADRIAACPADQTLMIEAWDQS